MGSFGERMKREREMRAITIEQIAESTKIGSRMLHALEHEDFAKLPGGIFNKGFVRAYAKYLGLDEEQAVTDFMTVYTEFQKKDQPLLGEPGVNGNGLSPAEAAAIAETIANTKSMSGDRRRPAQGAGFIAAGAVLVVVLGAGGFFFKYYEGKKAVAAVAAAKTRAERKLHPGSAAAALPERSSPTANADPSDPRLSSASTDSVLAANAATPDRVQTTPINDAGETSYPEYYKPSTQDPADASAAKRSKKNKVNLEIRAKEESWVRITGDGRLLMEGILSPSTSRQFNAARELVVKLGNAGVVDMSYNGKPLPAFSPDTKTKTITFTPDGQTSQ
jgi:cytoskeleton protein RodZ